MHKKVVWVCGMAHIRAWPIFPWIQTDRYGWYFSWLFIRIGRFSKYRGEIEEE
jgi:hypothetical protein